MAFRVDEVKVFKTYVICDDCGANMLLADRELGFDQRMNGAIANGFTFKNYGDGTFKNHCRPCQRKRN